MPDRVKHGPKPRAALFGLISGVHYQVTPAARRVYPHPKFIGGMAAAIADALPSKQRRQAIRYHTRRVIRIGHKPNRMNGFQRSCWGAAYHAYSDGYFPDWDPLQRHPNFEEFLLGDVYSGPFPQTPR